MARVEIEASDGGGEGGTFEVGPEPLQVGTSRRCQVRLEEQGISFVHAIISVDEQGCSILAKPSTAGTTVNGAPLRSGAARRLEDGDRLAFGKVQARFVDGPAAPSTPATVAPVAEAPPEPELPFSVPARMEAPAPAPPVRAPIAGADAGAEALLRRLEGAEGERDALRALARELEGDAEDARRALGALEARQEALQAERDALRREVARLEAAVRLLQARSPAPG